MARKRRRTTSVLLGIEVEQVPIPPTECRAAGWMPALFEPINLRSMV
jgi:hypothetical protein